MKIRLAKKIMKQLEYSDCFNHYKHFDRCNFYWAIRLDCYPTVPIRTESIGWKRDHRITKAINLTSKKKKYEEV